MPLSKRAIPINIAEGLDTKTDSKHVLPGKLTVLENGVYRKNKVIDKIPGYDRIESLDIARDAIPSASSLGTFNNELLQYSEQRVYSYSKGSKAWVDKGQAISAIIKSKQIIKNTAAQTQTDSAIISGIAVYAWEDSRGGVRASIVDNETGSNLLSDVELDAAATRVRCLAFKNYLFVFYYKSGSLYVRRINPMIPTAFESAVEISDTVNVTNPNYDLFAYDDLRILFAHNVEGASEIKAGWLNEVPEVLTGNLAPITISEAATNCLGIIRGPNQTFYFGYHDGSDVRCSIRNNGLDELFSAFTVETISDIVNITGYMLTDGVQFLYEFEASDTWDQYIKECKINNTGTADSPTVFKRSVGLYSKAFLHNGVGYVAVAHESTLQATYFVLNEDGIAVGKQQYTNAGGLTSRTILANVTQIGEVYFWAILKKIRIVSENATIFTPLGVMKTSIDFSNADIFTSKQIGNNLLVVGGVLSLYDGEPIVEHGFLLYPENQTVTPSGTGGSLDNGFYTVYILYEWTDQFGQIHRSQPSVASVVEVTGIGGNGSIDVEVPTLRITRKDGVNRTNISVVGYVTETDGTTAYRFTSIVSPIYNDVTVDSVSLGTITDVSSSNEILYTTGGVLPNSPAPACSVIEVFKNRVWLAGLEETGQVYYSKENKKGEPSEFTPEFNKSIENDGGDVIGLAVIDDKILAFKSERFYFTYGDGPNNTNTLGGFAEFENSNSDIGLEVANSIAAMPRGIILKTKKGFYYLDSSLTPQYVGADVEAYNNLNVTSAVLLSGLNEARFTTSDGDMLIYNYYYGRWSTSTGRKALAAVLFGSDHVILKTNGKILIENQDVFKDGEKSYRMRFITGWINLTGVNAFKRIYELMLVGNYKSPHKFRIKVGYDYSDSWEHEGVYDPDTNFPVEVYGQSSPYGQDGSLYGGVSNGYIIRVKMKRQKCAAVRICVEELTTTATEGSQEAFSFSDIGVLVGLKRGQAKVSRGKTMGVK